MAAHTRTVPDDDRPLPGPRARHATGKGAVKVTAVALAVTATVLGVVRLTAPAADPSKEHILAMAMSGAASSVIPGVAVFLCRDDDIYRSCAGGKVTEGERAGILRTLEAMPDVEAVTFESREQAWEKFRTQYADNDELLKAVNFSDMPESFQARIRAGGDASAVARAAGELPGVSNSINKACLFASGEECSFSGNGRESQRP
ncbi:hypothetical protein Misp01_45160 [Microtetraspora sp. NBRC 13810]|nr:hypothetical protein Misp01_45160 [Microtetraspora sp. NBRC 13810]